VKRMTTLFLCTAIAACTGGESLPGANAEGSGGMQAGCIDEFVQEVETVAEDPSREIPAGLCFADHSPPEGPPKFPATSRKTRIEYERGDYFITQETATWGYAEEPDTARNCLVAKLTRTTIIAIRDGDKHESVRIEGGKTQRSGETGDDYDTSLVLGSTPADQATVPGYSLAREATSFGVDCVRVSEQAGFKSATCSVVQPHTCRSVKVMLPIEMRTPNTADGMQVARTTQFYKGAVVNKSSWVLP
jgi:hypothetical protein